MTLLIMAAVVGSLFATGTFLVLRRRAIRLILGLGLLTHGVNLLLFSSGGLGRGLPPIILDKKAFVPADIDLYVDPLPQALILTAIVISFAVTAFTVVLVNRRQTLAQETSDQPQELPSIKATDPFASIEHYIGGIDEQPDDYEWLEFSLADELRARRAKLKAQQEAEAADAQETSESATQDGDADQVADAFDSQDGDLSTSEAFISEADADNISSDTTNSDTTGSNSGDEQV